MEKLKAKHDHKLTDILKVAIFGLMLILPGLILLPSMLYYGVNEYATAPTEQVEIYEYKQVDFNQIISPTYLRGDFTQGGLTFDKEDYYYQVNGTSTQFEYVQLFTSYQLQIFEIGHKYALTDFNIPIFINLNGAGDTISNDIIITADKTTSYFEGRMNAGTYDLVIVPQIFDLTQMFGEGNEPTIEQFKSYYTEDHYDYTLSKIETLEIPTGTYKTYTDITSQIQYNWNSLWQQPLFSWTNYTILKQGLDNFTYVFGITQTSYINNLITYELIMVAIYIVIDIVLTLFKWLTHLIGEK